MYQNHNQNQSQYQNQYQNQNLPPPPGFPRQFGTSNGQNNRQYQPYVKGVYISVEEEQRFRKLEETKAREELIEAVSHVVFDKVSKDLLPAIKAELLDPLEAMIKKEISNRLGDFTASMIDELTTTNKRVDIFEGRMEVILGKLAARQSCNAIATKRSTCSSHTA